MHTAACQSWARYYDCSADTARPFSEAYFVVLFSALPVRALEALPFANTGMGRELLLMEVEPAPGRSLIVGTAHLESLPQFAPTRVSQLKESLTVLRDRVNNADQKDSKCLGAVFMGDMNLMRTDMGLLDDRLAAIADVEVEPAKTGRSKCRVCQQTIEQGAVRIGKMAKERLPSGKSRDIRHWFHEACFMGKASEIEKQFVRERLPTQQAGGGAEQAANPTAIDLVSSLFESQLSSLLVKHLTPRIDSFRLLLASQEDGQIYGCRFQETRRTTGTPMMARRTD